MNTLSKLRPSPALVVALAALVAAMSGAALALPGKNSVKKNDIATGAVTGKKIADGAVKSKQVKGKSLKGNRLKDKAIKAKQIADDAISSAQVAENGLDTSDLSDVKSFAVGPVTATDGTTSVGAQEAAPKQQLFKKGQLTVYGKCFRDAPNGFIYAQVYIATAADGAIYTGSANNLDGGVTAGEFLNVATPENSRAIAAPAPTTDTTASEETFMAMAPDGTQLIGHVAAAAKEGNLPEGNGAFGSGNVCFFNGEVSG